MPLRLCASVAALAILAASIASPQGAGPIAVANAWSRATPPGTQTGVAYLEIQNSGEADALVGASSPIASNVEIHEMTMDGGMMQMRELARLEIPARARVRFEPSGKHLMLIGLQHPLKEGETFPITLTFRRAGAMQVQAIVAALGASSSPIHH